MYVLQKFDFLWVFYSCCGMNLKKTFSQQLMLQRGTLQIYILFFLVNFFDPSSLWQALKN